MKLLVLSIFIGIFGATSGQIFGRCFTPDEYRGSCIFLQNCPDLFSIIERKSMDPRERLFLSLSQCGFRDGKPLVCCRDTPATPPPPPPPPQSTQPTVVTTEVSFKPPNQGGNVHLPRPGVCGIDTENRIYGGNITDIDEYPWMVLMGYSKPNGKVGFHCGGSIINERYVLTASHCVNGKDLPPTWTLSTIRVGEWDLTTERDCDNKYEGEEICNNGARDILIEERIPHPQYDPYGNNQHNDIALIRLAQPLEFNEYVKPICLPSDPSTSGIDFTQKTLSVAGWGKTEKVSTSNIKLKVNVNGVSNNDCNRVYSQENRQIIDSQVCAGGKKGEDSCRGDSGGPLMRQSSTGTPPYWYLAGLVSYGPSPCGMEGWPGVYTRVANYVGWIQQTIRP